MLQKNPRTVTGTWILKALQDHTKSGNALYNCNKADIQESGPLAIHWTPLICKQVRPLSTVPTGTLYFIQMMIKKHAVNSN